MHLLKVSVWFFSPVFLSKQQLVTPGLLRGGEKKKKINAPIFATQCMANIKKFFL